MAVRVSLTPAPEPASSLLVLSGLLAVGMGCVVAGSRRRAKMARCGS
jgi:hypothetical protein